jgi:hypothetical protein
MNKTPIIIDWTYSGITDGFFGTGAENLNGHGTHHGSHSFELLFYSASGRI